MAIASFQKPDVKIFYNGVDKTDEFHWSNITIEDYEGNLSDRFVATMLWDNARPRMKDEIKVFINGYFLGKFIISAIRVDYKKSFDIEAVSVDFMSDFTKKKNRTFKDKSYKEIIEEIAKENDYKTKIDFKRMDEVNLLEQYDESDMNLCNKIAKDLELSFCVKNGYLIFFDRDDESHRINYFYNADDMISLSYEKKEKEVYQSCEVKWHSTKYARYKVARVGTKEPVLKITSLQKDESTALKLAEARLKSQKNLEINGNFSIIGTPFFAGAFINIKFDDALTKKFLITKITHTINTNWLTSAEFI